MAPGNCAFCGDQARRVGTLSRAHILSEYGRMFNLTFPDRVLATNFAFTNITAFECRRCGTRFYDPMVVGDASYYAHISENLRWYYQKDRWEFRLALDALKKAGARTFLEVGSGDGHFLELAASEGLAGVGFEINAQAVARLRGRGLNIRPELEGDHGPYDSVVMFQLVEHLRDPVSCLQSALRYLRRDGLLVLSTPVRPSCAALNSNVFLWPPHHQWLPTTAAYTHLAERLGLSCERLICDPPDLYQVRYAIQKWCGSLPFAKRRWRAAALENGLARALLWIGTRLRLEWAAAGHTVLIVLRNSRPS